MEKDVLPYFEKLSNWGWWGLDDQHRTLNFPSENKTLEAGLLVMEGTAHWFSSEFSSDILIKMSKSTMIQINIRKSFIETTLDTSLNISYPLARSFTGLINGLLTIGGEKEYGYV